MENIKIIMDEAHALRSPGPAATEIAWIGSGSGDVYFHTTLHCWDMAAAALITTEAGGCVLNADGSEFNLMGRTIVAAATQELAQEVVGKLKFLPCEPEFDEFCPL